MRALLSVCVCVMCMYAVWLRTHTLGVCRHIARIICSIGAPASVIVVILEHDYAIGALQQ